MIIISYVIVGQFQVVVSIYSPSHQPRPAVWCIEQQAATCTYSWTYVSTVKFQVSHIFRIDNEIMLYICIYGTIKCNGTTAVILSLFNEHILFSDLHWFVILNENNITTTLSSQNENRFLLYILVMQITIYAFEYKHGCEVFSPQNALWSNQFT